MRARAIAYSSLFPAFVLMLALFASAPAMAQAKAKVLTPWNGGATPSLVLRDVEGRMHDLKSYRGKVVLLNFWASWCEPCLQEMPSLEDLERRMQGKPFTVLAVNFAESEERVAAFLNNYDIRLRVLFDKDMAASKRWNARILPATFLIGADGQIRYSLLGEADWTSPPLLGAVEKLLAEKPRSGR